MSQLFGSTKITFGTHCLNIRHKAMYIGEVPNPGDENFYDHYDATAYWLQRHTNRIRPDGQPVRPDVCQSARGCCKH
jgi:hypothetical protein